MLNTNNKSVKYYKTRKEVIFMNTQKNELHKLANIKEVASATGITKSGLLSMIKKGIFPHGIKIGACRRWNIDDVNNWLDNQNQEAI